MEIGTISAFTRSDAASIPPFDAPKRSPVFAQHVHKLAVARDPSFRPSRAGHATSRSALQRRIPCSAHTSSFPDVMTSGLSLGP